MNRRQLAAVGVAAAIALVGVVGAFGGLAPSAPNDAGPADATPDTPADAEGTHLVTDGDAPSVEAASGQVVRGETPLEPGTELTLRVASNGSSPFLQSRQATVEEDGTFAATFDLSAAEPGERVRVTVHADDRELVNTTVAVTEPTGEPAGGATPTETADLATVDHEGDALTLATASGQVVSGTTELEPGTEIAVSLRSTGGSQPFLVQRTTTVGDDGSFEATFNMSDRPAGAEFTVSVVHDGDELTSAPGELAESE